MRIASPSNNVIGRAQAWLHFTSPGDAAFALRTALAGVAALFVAMWLQLDVPRWAMWTVVVVSLPVRGNALRKTAARLVGTAIGCSVGLTVVALFPQDRIGFYLTFSLWLGACAYWATLRQGYVSYAAILAAFTSAIVSADVSTTPTTVWNTTVSRGSATVIGTLFALLASEMAARSDDIPGDLAKRVRSFAADLLDWAVRQLDDGNSDDPKDAPFAAKTLELHETCINAIAERSALGWVKSWILGLPTALLSLQSSVLDLREEARHGRASSADLRLARGAIGGTAEFLRSNAAVDLTGLRRQSEELAALPDNSPANFPAVKGIIDPLLYLLASLEAILSVRPPSSPAPVYPSPQFIAHPRLATTNLIRTVTGMLLGFMIWDATAWTHGPVFLINVAVALVLFVRMEDPVAGNQTNVIGNLIGGVVAIAAKYFVLVRYNDPLVLAAVVFLLLFIGAWVEAKPGLSALGLFYLNGLQIVMEPMNPQKYDFVDDVNIVIALTLAYAFVSLVFLIIGAPRSGRERILELLARMRRRRQQVESCPTRRGRLCWETQMYDELQRLQAATSNPRQREKGVNILLSGLRSPATFAGAART